MNYKRFIGSRKIRIRILGLLSWIPDRVMIPVQYRIHTGRKLDLRNPVRFTEKLQLYKMCYRNPLMLRCSDKIEARSVVIEKGFGDILIPLYGVYDDPGQIEFDKLPCEFVVKTNDGYGGNQVLICHDRNNLDRESFYATLKGWMKFHKGKHPGREWAYDNGYPRKIIIEKLLMDEVTGDAPDYKFLCFNGDVKIIYVIHDRIIGKGGKLGVFSPDMTRLDVIRTDELPLGTDAGIPVDFSRMVEIAEKLSDGFPHARIDLYNVNGKIYFGEYTFYDGSGYFSFAPDDFDRRLGDCFELPSTYIP